MSAQISAMAYGMYKDPNDLLSIIYAGHTKQNVFVSVVENTKKSLNGPRFYLILDRA